MKTYTLSNAQAELLQKFEDAEIKAPSWWGRGEAAERLYFNSGRKDAKVFVTFADPQTLSQPKLNIYIDDNGAQPAAWYLGQKKRIAENMDEEMQVICAATV